MYYAILYPTSAPMRYFYILLSIPLHLFTSAPLHLFTSPTKVLLTTDAP